MSFTYSQVLTDNNCIYKRPLWPHLTSCFWGPGYYSLAKLACKASHPNIVLLDMGHSHLLPLFPSCHLTHWVKSPLHYASWPFATCSSRGLESSTAFLCVLVSLRSCLLRMALIIHLSPSLKCTVSECSKPGCIGNFLCSVKSIHACEQFWGKTFCPVTLISPITYNSQLARPSSTSLSITTYSYGMKALWR